MVLVCVRELLRIVFARLVSNESLVRGCFDAVLSPKRAGAAFAGVWSFELLPLWVVQHVNQGEV